MVLIVTKENRDDHKDVLERLFRRRFDAPMLWRRSEDCWMVPGLRDQSFSADDRVYFIKTGRRGEILGGFILSLRPPPALKPHKTSGAEAMYGEWSSFFVANRSYRDGRGHPVAYELFCALMDHVSQAGLAGLIGCLEEAYLPCLHVLPWNVRRLNSTSRVDEEHRVSLREDVCLVIDIGDDSLKRFTAMKGGIDLYFRRMNARDQSSGVQPDSFHSLMEFIEFMGESAVSSPKAMESVDIFMTERH